VNQKMLTLSLILSGLAIVGNVATFIINHKTKKLMNSYN